MEKLTSLSAEKVKAVRDHKVIIDNRKKVTVTAVTKALSANESTVLLQLTNNKILISGKSLFISKLDLEQGIAEVDGEINSIKYTGSVEAGGFLKRIFKWLMTPFLHIKFF